MIINTNDILDIIQKKYNNSKFKYDQYSKEIIYLIEQDEYKIRIYFMNSDLKFTYINYKLNIDSVIVTLKDISNNFDEKKIIKKFNEILNHIKNIHLILKNKIEYTKRLQQIITNFIKDEYNIEIEFDNKNNKFTLDFPNTVVFRKKRNIHKSYNILKEDTTKIKYNCTAIFNYNNAVYNFNFTYSVVDNTLIFIKRRISYLKNDITRIVRCEKIKKLNSVSNEN